MSDLINLAEAGELLGLGLPALTEMIKSDRLTLAGKDGLKFLVPRAEVEEIIRNRENWVTVQEAARALRVSTLTIERRIKAGEIRTAGMDRGPGGCHHVIHKDEIERILRPVEPDLEPLPEYPVRRWKRGVGSA